MNSTRTSPLAEPVVFVLIGIGVLLRVWQFAGGASLFIDEVGLAGNIAARGYAALLAPLDYGQMAPPGFLLAERFFWGLFHNDWSLRLIPFVASIASLVLFRALAMRTLDDVAVPLAVGAMAVGVPFIMYAAQVKQYSSDVALAIAFPLMAVNLLQNPDRSKIQCGLFGLAGFASVWFSNAAVLVVAGTTVALVLVMINRRLIGNRRVAWLVIAPWCAGALLASVAAKGSVYPHTLAFMKQYWRHGFMPWPPASGQDIAWPWLRVVEVFGPPVLRYRFAFAFALLAMFGCVMLWRRRGVMALVLVAPVIVTFGAALLHQYPFQGRLVLFLAPAMLLAMAQGARDIAAFLNRHIRFAGSALFAAIVLIVVQPVVGQPPVYRIQEMGPLLQWVAMRRQTDDRVFVWYRAKPNVAWEGPRLGFNPRTMVAGGCWLERPRELLKDTDALRGHPRVWVIEAGGGPELTMFHRYIDSIARKVEERRLAPTVPGHFSIGAALYDFSDTTRLNLTSAETFAFEIPPFSDGAIKGCTEGPMAMGLLAQ